MRLAVTTTTESTLSMCTYYIHSFGKTLWGEKYQGWTMRHNGNLGRRQGQVCYWVSFLDIQNILFPR